jgi:hypothetical protein
MYAVNDVKKDPATGFIAVKTGSTDPLKSWLVVLTADGATHAVEDADVSSWLDLEPVSEEP